MSNIIKFPKEAPYRGDCPDCQEVIVSVKKLEKLAWEAAEYSILKKMPLWDRVFAWPYKE